MLYILDLQLLVTLLIIALTYANETLDDTQSKQPRCKYSPNSIVRVAIC